MISWLLSWYGTAEVLESQWLKDMIVKSLKETMDV
jgi:hypothetical protein